MSGGGCWETGLHIGQDGRTLVLVKITEADGSTFDFALDGAQAAAFRDSLDQMLAALVRVVPPAAGAGVRQ